MSGAVGAASVPNSVDRTYLLKFQLPKVDP